MSKQVGPIEICCDAPPYLVVRACAQLGFTRPEDVRWCRMGRFLNEQAGRPGPFSARPWDAFLGGGDPEARSCTCGEVLPRLEYYLFVLMTGERFAYLFGQCGRCQTMYWEEG